MLKALKGAGDKIVPTTWPDGESVIGGTSAVDKPAGTSPGYGWTKVDECVSRGKTVNVTLESQDKRYKATVFWDRGFILKDRQNDNPGCISVAHIADITFYLEALEEEAIKHFGVEWAE